jgi:hypothetical protein
MVKLVTMEPELYHSYGGVLERWLVESQGVH